MKRTVILLTVGLAACSGTQPPEPANPARPSGVPPSNEPGAAPSSGPPSTPAREATDTYFGVEVKDPYRWLEKQDAPDVAAWMKAQADHARTALDALPLRKELFDRMTELDQGGVNVPYAQAWGGRYFYIGSPAGKDTMSLYVREVAGGKERILVDAEALTKGEALASIDSFFPSPDGSYVAYGLSLGGSEDNVLHVVETSTGRELPEVFDRTYFPSVSWPDGKSFLYTRFPPLAPGAPESEKYNRDRVYLHTLGTRPESDPAVFGHGLIPSIEIGDTDYSDVVADAGGDLVFARFSGGTASEMDIQVAHRRDLKTQSPGWKKLYSAKEHGITAMAASGGDLYLLTHKDAPHFKVLKTSVRKPDFASAEVVVPESDVILKAIALGKDGLYVQALDAGKGRLFRVRAGQKKAEEIALPAAGPLRELFAEPTTPGVLFQQRSWTTAQKWHTFDAKEKKLVDTRLVPDSTVDFSSIAEDHLFATSKDGTKVPISIVYRKDIARDGTHPLWLDGYGSYGWSFEPFFQPTRLAWLERGAVIAVCHARGGGELGEAWHMGGVRANKQNGIDDYIACAEHLIREKWTSEKKLCGVGKSAGGLLIGNAISRRPELFRAALIDVGVSDALRAEQEISGPANIPEFGTVKIEEQFKWMLATSPYAQVKDGVAYPAVLLTAGMRDARVSPWQPAKMAARLQHATSSGRPVLLRIDYEAGHHTVLVSKSKRNGELADQYAFFLSQTE